MTDSTNLWMTRIGRALRGPLILKTFFGLLAFWLALVAFAFLFGPMLARSILTEQLSRALDRPVSIRGVEIHPLQLSARIEGLSVNKREGGEQLGFEALEVDLSSQSILKAGLVVQSIRLQAPRIAVARLADHRYDISDWLDQWLGGKSQARTALPRFSISNIEVTDGRFVFDDRPKGVQHQAESVHFSLPFVSSLPYKTEVFVEPAFSAVVDGAQLELKARSQPFVPSHASTLDIELQALDLAPLRAYWPDSLPLRLQAGQFSTRLSLDFAEAPEGQPTLSVSGMAQLRGLKLNEATGTPWLALDALDLELDKADPVQGRWTLQDLSLRGLQIVQGAGQPPLEVQTLAMQEVQADVPARLLQVGRLQGSGVQARMLRDAGGPVRWIALPPSPSSGTPAAAAQDVQAPSWTARIGQLRLDGLAARFEDRSLSPAAVQDITQASLSADQLELRPGHENTFTLVARVNGSGRVEASGALQWQPLAARLKLQTRTLPLVPLQGYLATTLNTTLVQGVFSSQGDLDLSEHKEGLKASYRGSITLGQLHAVDPAQNTDFLKWTSLHVGAVDFQLDPGRLKVGEIALTDFYSRLILDKQGRLNLADLLRQPAGDDRPKATAAAPGGASAWPVEIAKVTLNNGRVDFTDRFVQPNYSASVARLGGSVRNLSSAPDTLAELDLRGSYAGNAPVLIAARLNPLAENKFLDLKAQVSSVDLVDFSPYSGKYAGYKIDKGKLSLNASYKLENRQLSADNRLFIDQLTFGDKVESPDATQLPVHLAIALLRNNRGEIDINLPISGSLDDPQFSLGGLIFKVIGNLIVKAVSSPFALLGSLFGDGQELSQITFAPGRDTLDEAARQKLQTLAKALREREALRLEITAGADTALDPEGLRRVALERAVLAEKRKDSPAAAPSEASAADLPMDAGDYARYLERAYQQARFPKPRNLLGLPKELPVADMEKLMLASQTVGNEDLQALATRRAQAVQTWLVEQGQVALARLFLLPVQTGQTADSGPGRNRVDFSLR